MLVRGIRIIWRVAAMASRPTTETAVPLNGTRPFWWHWFSWLPRWKPTSEAHLEEAERQMLTAVKSDYEDSYVSIAPNAVVRTVTMESEDPSHPENLPLVMVHGFGAGVLQFYKNLDHLHSKRKLLALDLPGFARSTRIPFTPDAQKAEEEFVDRIEKWRQGVGVEKFILLGHSLGGFLACSYTMKYPSRVRHLILVDPWGFALPPPKKEVKQRFPFWARVLWGIVAQFNPYATMRAAGPWGQGLADRLRPDLQRTFGGDFMNYVYHCNAQKPAGETAYYHMQHYFGWAKRPMLTRIDPHLDPQVPITMIYGVKSWMDIKTGEKVRELRPNSHVDIVYVKDAGHHVHANQPEAFNSIVNGVCSLVDAGKDRGEDATTLGDVHESASTLAAGVQREWDPRYM